MIIRLALVLLLSFAGFAQASEGENFPHRMKGTWEGILILSRYANAEPVTMPDLPNSSHMKLVIGDGTMITYYLDSDTPHKPEGLLNKFEFTLTSDTITGSYFASGGDKDGRWDEAQSIVLQRIDDDMLHVYWLRAVSNVEQAQQEQNTKWATLKFGKLKRTN